MNTAATAAAAAGPNPALSAAKQQLRSLMKQRLSAVPAESISIQSRRAFEALRAFPPYRDAGRVSIFLSMPGGEIQTGPIVRDALAQGKHVFVPYLHRSPLASPLALASGGGPVRVMDMVRLRGVRDYDGLQPDRWGIPSVDPASVHERQRILGGPDAHGSERATLDLIIMPGVAFGLDPAARTLRRLGHGKGFYDYFVERYMDKVAACERESASSGSSSVFLCGLALSEQFLGDGEEEVPVGPQDHSLHSLILGSGDVVATSRSPNPV